MTTSKFVLSAFRYLLLALILFLTQWFLQSYLLMLVIWILAGAVLAMVQPLGKNFFPAFWIELIIAYVLFFLMSSHHSDHVKVILENVGYGGFYFTLLILLFNGLNAAFCVTLGSIITKLFLNNRNK